MRSQSHRLASRWIDYSLKLVEYVRGALSESDHVPRLGVLPLTQSTLLAYERMMHSVAACVNEETDKVEFV